MGLRERQQPDPLINYAQDGQDRRHVLAAVSGVAAAATGAVDFSNIPTVTRAKRVSLAHAIGKDIVLFGLIAFLRYRADPCEPSALARTFAGAGISFVTGWLGGELVERLGVGVDSDAKARRQQLTRGWTVPTHAAQQPRTARRRQPPPKGPCVRARPPSAGGAGVLAVLGGARRADRVP